MIAGYFNPGSGLGDQLFRYITVRTLAEEKGWEWDMVRPEYFKGNEFMKNLQVSGDMPMDPIYKTWYEKDVRDDRGVDIRSYDPEINFIEDWTVIDGSFEDDKYWGHNLKNINEWLKVEPLDVPVNTCILGFRGGEYATDHDLFLTKDYYSLATEEIFKRNDYTTFEVHTDDVPLAEKTLTKWLGTRVPLSFIENTPISHSKHSNMGFNWRSARYAKRAIIPNSAFFILPRLLKHMEDPKAVTIAPRYWARRNTKTWARPACYYKPFTYV